MVDTFRLCVALGPLAIYLLTLGLINLSQRPLVVSGARDTAALGLSVIGMVLVGPIELLLPNRFAREGMMVWLMVLGMYILSLSLAVLMTRPRLVIYNISLDQLRPVLAQVIDQLDDSARWVGSSLVLPRLHVELHLESSPLMRNVSLVAAGDEQSFVGWRQLEVALATALRRSGELRRSWWGLAMTLLALLVIAQLGWLLASDPQAVTQGFRDMLRL